MRKGRVKKGRGKRERGKARRKEIGRKSQHFHPEASQAAISAEVGNKLAGFAGFHTGFQRPSPLCMKPWFAGPCKCQ